MQCPHSDSIRISASDLDSGLSSAHFYRSFSYDGAAVLSFGGL